MLASPFRDGEARALRASYSSDGHFLAVHYRWRGVILWEIAANKERTLITVSSPEYVIDMMYADGDRTLVTIMGQFMGLDGKAGQWHHSAVRWDASTGKKLAAHVFDPTLFFKALSPNGRYALLQASTGQTAFDLVTGKRAFVIHGDGEFVFSNDSSALACYDGDEARVWDVPSGRQLKYFAFKPGYCAGSYCGHRDGVSMSPNKKLLAVCDFGRTHVVGVISLDTGRSVDKFEWRRPLC